MEQLIAQIAQAMAGQNAGQYDPDLMAQAGGATNLPMDPASQERYARDQLAHSLERQIRARQDVLSNPNAGMPEIAQARDGYDQMMTQWGELIDAGAGVQQPTREEPQGSPFTYTQPIDPRDEYLQNELGGDYQKYLQMTPDERLRYLNDPANGFVPPR